MTSRDSTGSGQGKKRETGKGYGPGNQRGASKGYGPDNERASDKMHGASNEHETGNQRGANKEPGAVSAVKNQQTPSFANKRAPNPDEAEPRRNTHPSVPATVVLRPGKEKQARNFHPWIFSGALEPESRRHIEELASERLGPPDAHSSESPENHGEKAQANAPMAAAPVSAIRVLASDGSFVAWAWPNPRSQILLRIVSFREDEYPDEAFLNRTLVTAVALRESLGLLGTDQTTVCRLVFSESDGIPGLIVDRFGSIVIVQYDCAGPEFFREEIETALIAVLRRFLPDLRAIWERSDGDGRKLEGLPRRFRSILGDEPPAAFPVLEHGLNFLVDPRGQKTGFYADQRENRATLAGYLRGKDFLDVCGFSGGFSASALRAGAASVTLVDQSLPSLDLAKQNIAANFPDAAFTTVCADAFEYLRGLEPRSQDAICFDPPKLIPSRKAKDRGLRAYKDGNLHAIRAVKPGGILASFSCSGLLSASDFELVVAYAAKDAGRRVQILHRLSQAPCHPVLLSFPEGQYLKGLILRVL